jgi:elongation factor Ts
MSITLEQIKSLRDKTGISTTACKKALVEAEGDMQKAIDLLRKKGQAKAADRADRKTENGIVAIAKNDTSAAMIAIGCETDFVAKNEDFIAQIQKLAEKLLAEGESADFTTEVADMNIQMGEKIAIADKKVIQASTIGTYIHQNNRISVLVAMNGGEVATASDVAIHVAALNPVTLSPEDMDDAIIAKEKEIWIAQLQEQGKPENIMENILKGKEKKFRSASALLAQAFVKNPEQSIKELIGENTIEAFYRFEV